MKKKSVAKLFFKSLLKSLVCICLIGGVGFASYKISYSILTKDSGSISSDSDSLQDILKDATTDEISKNLIYVSNEKDKITDVMLEICNTKTNNIDYITVPSNTDYTIPSVMYRKLCQVNPEIPQMIRVSKLKQYFEEESDAYGYGVLIFEKMLGTDISYYTALTKEVYDNHYTRQKVNVTFKTESVAEDSTPGPDGVIPETETTAKTPMKISVFSEAYREQLTDLGSDEDKIADFIKDQYERIDSNLTVYNKLGYLETYEKADVSLFHFWGVPGSYNGKRFEVDGKACKKAVKGLTGNENPYTEAQDLSAPNNIAALLSGKAPAGKGSGAVASSKGLKIYVLNGSQIAGLASTTKAMLEQNGYTVPKVGNYQQETLTTTQIKVTKKGQGEDLVQYFSNPKISVGGVTEGYDIEIILGTADAN